MDQMDGGTNAHISCGRERAALRFFLMWETNARRGTRVQISHNKCTYLVRATEKEKEDVCEGGQSVCVNERALQRPFF